MNPAELKPGKFGVEERFMISKLNSTIARVTGFYENYYLNDVPWAVEELYLALSRNYVRLVRDKLSLGTEEEKASAIYTIYSVLMGSLKMFAPIAPFITEAIYLDLKKEFGLKEESVHHLNWPSEESKLIDTDLEKEFVIVDSITQRILYGRDKLNLGVRWPISEVIIVSEDKEVESAVNSLSQLMMIQTNIKKIVMRKDIETRKNVKADYEKLRKDFGGLTAIIIAHLALVSPSSILGHIEKEGRYEMTVENAKIEIKGEHLIVEKEAPVDFILVDFPRGEIYINKKMTKELEAEGFARELVRRVQEFRKTSGLSKADRIELFVTSDSKMVMSLKDHKEEIKERVGASGLVLSDRLPEKTFRYEKKIDIRGKGFDIWFNKH
jgi:isoleucyl-tRNA synthetase